MARRLIINADDFGFTTDVNLGIVDAHRNGILTATTLMANGAAFDHAVALAKENPPLDVGCHLVLVGGVSVSAPGVPLPRTVRQLVWRLLDAPASAWVERELTAQVEKVLQAGIEPSHLDTHKHTHLAPGVLDAVCRLSERFGIPWIRRPFDLPLAGRSPKTRFLNRTMRLFRRRFDRTLALYNCRTTDHFAGFNWTGRVETEQVIQLVRHLPDGLTEFMCHPGHCTAELRRAPTRLKESRAKELTVLISPEVRDALQSANVELTDYRRS